MRWCGIFLTKNESKNYERVVERYKPQYGDFRIVPNMNGTCTVEEYKWSGSRGSIWTYSSGFKTEEDAESYISSRLKDRAEMEAQVKKQKEFTRANPPRIVPPYKFLTEKPKEGL